MRKRSLLLAAGACLAALSLTAGSALADPVPPTPERPLAGVGSDTTQDIMNAYGNGTTLSTPPFPGGVVTGSGARAVASFDAVGSTPINTHPSLLKPDGTARCSITRPNGSGAGITALHTSDLNADGCVQFARSSVNDSQDTARNGFNLTYIPFATDVLHFATASQTAVGKNLTRAALIGIYSANASDPGGCGPRQPLIPQANSGTRKAWLAYLGLTAPGDCVKDTLNVNGVPTPIEEHDGTRIKNDPNCGAFGGCLASQEIVPFSTAQWITQTTNPSVNDKHGSTVLRAIDGFSPFDYTPRLAVRSVFNVIRTSDIGVAPFNTVFVGSGSQICTHPEVLKVFNFGSAANCGVTTIHTN